MATRSRRSSRPAEARDDAEQGTCRVPGCPSDEQTRGLCDAHWWTHRGLATPDPDAPTVDEDVTVP